MLKLRYVGIGLLAVFPAVGTTITSTTYSSWTTNVSGTPTFEDVETLPQGNYNTSSGITDGAYIFTGPDGSGWLLGSQKFSNKGGLFGASDGIGAIEAMLPGSGQSAIYLAVNTVANNALANGSLTLHLSDGESFTLSSGQFGLSISHQITWYTLTTSSGQAPFLEWAYFGNSSLPQDGGGSGSGDPPQAPEATTIALVSGGMLIVVGIKRKFGNVTKFVS